jgi:hypothetical protein
VEPPARPKLGCFFLGLVTGGDVGKEGVTDGGALIPAKHRINSLAKFHQISLVDTTCVDPDISEAIFFGLLAASTKLNRAKAGFIGVSLVNITERELFDVAAPSMR